MDEPYRGYDVLAKWDSPSFDTVTRGVIRRRLEAVPERRFFTEGEFRTLHAVALRLTAQGEGSEPVPIAPWIDADIFEGRDAGFRHADLPPGQEVWRLGLAGIEAEARHRYTQAFTDLPSDRQDAILRAVQTGEANPENFGGVSTPRLFTAILGTVVGIYYGHPAAWSEIGFGGPASPRGYVRMGLDERDPWEARQVREQGKS